MADALSSNGRTPPFEGENLGSSPSGASIALHEALLDLITAVEWELPAIRDGVDVERRVGILYKHVKAAKRALPLIETRSAET